MVKHASSIIDKVIGDFDHLFDVNCNPSNRKWRNQLMLLSQIHHELTSVAHEFDFSPELKYNGIRSYLKMLVTYFVQVRRTFRKFKHNPRSKKNLEELKVLRGQCFNFVSMGESMKRIRNNWSKVDVNNNQGEQFNIVEAEDSFIRVQREQTESKMADFYNMKFWFPWLALWLRLLVRLIISSLYVVSTPVKQSAFGVFSNATLSKFFTHLMTRKSIRSIARTINGHLEGFTFSLFIWTSNLWYRGFKVSYPTLFHRQIDWIIDPNSRSIKKCSKGNPANEKPINCVFIEPRNSTSKDLIVHIHGGGFVITSARTYIPFLRPIVGQTGTSVISISFSLSPDSKYPVALQECFDLYINLLSSESIAGFHPRKIIFLGESAGGYLALALCIAIAELRTLQLSLREPLTPLPHAVNAIYPTASGCMGHLYPSRALMDLCIFPKCFPHYLNAYSGCLDDEDFFNERGFHWHEDESTLKLVCSKVNSRIDDPFFHLPAYRHFNRLKSVPLYVQATEFDPLLDDSIALAKCWKGPVKLDIITDVIHGWTMLESIAPKTFKGCQIIRNNIQEALKIVVSGEKEYETAEEQFKSIIN